MSRGMLLLGLVAITKRTSSFITVPATLHMSHQTCCYNKLFSTSHTKESLEAMNIAELKVLLKEKKLFLKGRKAELVHRLIEAERKCEAGDVNTRALSTSHVGTSAVPKAVTSTTMSNSNKVSLRERPIIPRTSLQRKNFEERRDSKFIRAISWNVNGLRSLLRDHSQSLLQLLRQEKPHVVCFQVLET
jgi:hypothetical protein